MATPLTNIGSRPAAFGPAEWGLTLAVGIIWGSAFLWIALGVDFLTPGVVAFGRVALGALALACFPSARKAIARKDWGRVAAVGILGNAGPAILFAEAETTLDSAVAGMIAAGTPILSLVVAGLILRRMPGRAQIFGIGIGFIGIIMMAMPSLGGADASPIGVLLIFLATVGYAVTSNILVPLEQEYGGPAVILWALIFSSVVLAPLALVGIEASEFKGSAVLAVIILGVVGTGIARALSATLAGRVGGPRMSTTNYIVPVVAIILGVVFLNESVSPIAVAGVVVVMVGAFWATRAVRTD